MKWIPLDAIPGVTILPHWQAPKYTAGGMVDERAVLWHMAQGGGTDTWLTRTDGAQGNNSSHIIVKLDGGLRQIVSLEDAAWSLHIDRPDGPPDGPLDDGLFSLDAAQRVLGGGWQNPNAYGIAIEVEGYANYGPNAAQKKTMVALARYLERLFPKIRHLGHRDFQDYKACPGRLIFNEILPHEGRVSATTTTPEPEPTMNYSYEHSPATIQRGTIRLNGTGHYYLLLKDGTLHGPLNPTDPAWIDRPAIGPVTLTTPIPGGPAGQDRVTAYLIGRDAAALLAFSVIFTAEQTADKATIAELRKQLADEQAADTAAAERLRDIANELAA